MITCNNLKKKMIIRWIRSFPYTTRETKKGYSFRKILLKHYYIDICYKRYQKHNLETNFQKLNYIESS